MSFDIQQQMQANLAQFYLLLKQTEADVVQYQDLQGTNFEGKIIGIQPSMQNLHFQFIKNLITNEQINSKQIQLKEMSYLKIQQAGQEKQISKSEKKEKTFVRFDQNVIEHNLEDQPKCHFDQFEAIRKFGLEPTFDENHYTTQIKVQINQELKQFAEQQELDLKKESKPEQISKHTLEERNLKELDDHDDEELLYSAVIRSQTESMVFQPASSNSPPDVSELKVTRSNAAGNAMAKPENPIIVQPRKADSNQFELLFYNSNRGPRSQDKVVLIPDEEDYPRALKQKGQDKEEKLKLQQIQQHDLPKMLLHNFVTDLEGYKWQTMQPDTNKNRKEKLVQ